MSKLAKYFVYCGVGKDEYLSVKKDAYVSNFRVWKFLHIFMLVAYVALLAEAFLNGGETATRVLRIATTAYTALVTVLFFTVIKEDSLIGQLIIYLTMIILLVTNFLLGLQTPEMMGVSFIVVLVLLPMFMIDRPFYMAIVLVLAAAIFIYHSHMLKTPAAFRGDLINGIAYALLGIIINTFYNTIRVKEFLLAKNTSEHIAEQEKAMKKAEGLNAALQKMSENLIEVLGDVVESRDAESGDHIQRVKGYTNILAKQVMKDIPEYGLDNYTVNLMTFASALHDVGKISIPDAILLKPGKLTKEEFDIMKTHCEKGRDIVMKMKGAWSEEYLQMGLDICMYHHEKWDGRGYPKGLRGDEIPIAAQIVSVADIYDALTTKRVYKAAYLPEEAFHMIINGECGTFSQKLMSCFKKCRDKFEELKYDPDSLKMEDYSFEVIGQGDGKDAKYVIGLHDEDRNLKEKLKLSEELSIISSLSERFLYVGYVNLKENEMYRFKVDETIANIMDGFGEDLKCHEKFDKLLNTIIVASDYEKFRQVTDRQTAMRKLQETGHVACGFRVRLEDGVHYCRMRITVDKSNPDAVIIGIINVDEEHKREIEQLELQKELEETKKEMKNRETLEEQLAVISTISSEYDYVCALNADTFQVTVYHAEPWICDMFKNLEDIVKSPEVRDETLKGIIHPDDFDEFCVASRHENVMRGLAMGGGVYHVDYRGYKYGQLTRYQSRYVIDKKNPKRIIIGLRSMDLNTKND